MVGVTEWLAELGVIIATRRRRSPSDPEVWAAHIAVVEGPETGPIQIETDRAKFIGRGHSLQDPVMADAALSGTTKLDSVFKAINAKFSGKVAQGNIAGATEAFELVRARIESARKEAAHA